MTTITLENISHSYPTKNKEKPLTLKKINMKFENGGAYALLGPSGCGKTTLLNIISGLITPTEGRVLFDGKDVTHRTASERYLSQVFQFPVVYDTMTVFDNLAFPLRNHGMDEKRVVDRVRSIAKILELTDYLFTVASGLTADTKQKISLGRGLVREDVNIIMFDEPLTVIDPHLKWKLRTQLKELHQVIGSTLIYVTHDQTEALTFADQVSVMFGGEIVQSGNPTELFERSDHIFVGHFIGSPGMNIIPCEVDGSDLRILGLKLKITNYSLKPKSEYRVGVRPEFLTFSKTGIAVEIVKTQDLGRYKIVEINLNRHLMKIIVPETIPIPDRPKINFDVDHTHLYEDGWRKDCQIKVMAKY